MIKNSLFLLKLEWMFARKLFIWLFLQVPVTQIFVFLPLYIIKKIIEYITTSTIYDNYTLVIYVLVLFATGFIATLFYEIERNIKDNNLFIYDYKYKMFLYEKSLRVNPKYFESNEIYDIYSKVTQYSIYNIHNSVSQVFDFLSKSISIAIAIFIMIQNNAIIAILFIIVYIPILIVSLRISDKTFRFFFDNSVNERKKDLLFSYVNNRNAVQELKIYSAFPFVINLRTKISQSLNDKSFKMNLKNLNTRTLFTSFPEVLYYSAYLYYAILVLKRFITLADFTFITGSISVFRSNLTGIVYFLDSHINTIRQISMLRNFLDLDEERTNNKQQISSFENIILKNIYFKYPNSKNNVLSNINLSITKGEKLAIVGYNGSGKTTLAKLLIGLFDEYNGEYNINGINSKSINHKEIYNLFSMAMQDYQKYPFTVQENIMMETASQNDVYKYACDLSDIEQLIDSLELKEQTNLNKEYDLKGIDLSEGQWHKIILARTIYQNREIVLFDEPTANLDPIAEYNFIKNIMEKLKNKTVIMISHRLSSVIDFDNIILMKNGEIIESGSHKDLLNLNGEYTNIFSTQAKRYNTE